MSSSLAIEDLGSDSRILVNDSRILGNDSRIIVNDFPPSHHRSCLFCFPFTEFRLRVLVCRLKESSSGKVKVTSRSS